jgi:hypothetical protein
VKAGPSGVSETSITDAAKKEKYFLKKIFKNPKNLYPASVSARIAHCKIAPGMISYSYRFKS